MVKHIRKAAVIGSGVMGSGIAAHLANIGIPVLLLDMVPRELTDEERKSRTLEDPDVRNRLAQSAVQKLLKQNRLRLLRRRISAVSPQGTQKTILKKLKMPTGLLKLLSKTWRSRSKCFQKSINTENTEASSAAIHQASPSGRWRREGPLILKSTFRNALFNRPAI